MRPMDYEPLDFSRLCNAGTELYDPEALEFDGTYLQPLPDTPPTGQQEFHGLPFLIGGPNAADDLCFLGFGSDLYTTPVSIPINSDATYVLFAHAVLETDLWKGGLLGMEVARYVFHFTDGESITTMIRERFEIGNVPLPWGQFPFLCVPDQKDYLEGTLSRPLG